MIFNTYYRFNVLREPCCFPAALSSTQPLRVVASDRAKCVFWKAACCTSAGSRISYLKVVSGSRGPAKVHFGHHHNFQFQNVCNISLFWSRAPGKR